MPPEVTSRPKQGFSAPDASWFRGESIEFVKDSILNPDATLTNYFDRALIRGLVEEHLGGVHNRRLLIWSFLYLEEWLSTYIRPLPVSNNPELEGK
jgi:asparagine synthase (glutamine-hydrolysing)